MKAIDSLYKKAESIKRLLGVIGAIAVMIWGAVEWIDAKAKARDIALLDSKAEMISNRVISMISDSLDIATKGDIESLINAINEIESQKLETASRVYLDLAGRLDTVYYYSKQSGVIAESKGFEIVHAMDQMKSQIEASNKDSLLTIISSLSNEIERSEALAKMQSDHQAEIKELRSTYRELILSMNQDDKRGKGVKPMSHQKKGLFK